MNKGEIIEALGKWNFWNREIDAGINREQTDNISRFIDSDKVVTLVGVRRCGKSYIVKQLAKKLMENGTKKNNILIVNFEEPVFEGADLKFLLKIYGAYTEIIRPSKKPYLFLDEIQEIPKWEKFVRSINETKDAFVIITGSSSKLLSEELASILTGRQITFEIFPLSFKEFLKFNHIEIAGNADIYLNAGKIRSLIYEYIESGGFPEVVLSKNEELKRKIIVNYYDTIINRDIVTRFKIRRMSKLRTLAKYYLTNISSPITYRKISRFLDLPVETVSRYTEYLTISKLIFFADRFSYSLKEQVTSPRKVYSIDVGLSNTLGFRFSENLGRIIENIVAVEFKRRESKSNALEIYYWKDYYGKEVDFVIKDGFKIKQLIQVCYDIEDYNTKERELASLIKASKELECDDLLVITWDHEGEEEFKKKKVKFIPLWKWLL